jgi:hypothetical protein
MDDAKFAGYIDVHSTVCYLELPRSTTGMMSASAA